MKKYSVTVVVHYSAEDEVEIEAEDEESARRQATLHHGISAWDAEADYVETTHVECIDNDEGDEEDGEEKPLPITRDQIILPGCEPLLAGFQWAQ